MPAISIYFQDKDFETLSLRAREENKAVTLFVRDFVLDQIALSDGGEAKCNCLQP